VAVSMLLVPFLGEDFFPSVDSGQITLHARTPAGTRVEDTTQIVAKIEREVRRIIPKSELTTIVDNIGLNQSPVNLIYSNSGTVGLQDADIFITLNEGHRRTADYVRTMREQLPRLFTSVAFSFPPPDITSQILNFGAPAPLDVQVTGTDRALPSGPLHDAAEVARTGVPTVMVFSSSSNGISHAKEEDTPIEHLELALRAYGLAAQRVIAGALG